MTMRTFATLLLGLSMPTLVVAQAGPKLPPAYSAITQADLKRDLYYLASDSMRGRRAGTTDELRASMWIADQLRKIGVQPMGDNGTYFQWWNLRRTRLSSNSVIRVGNHTFTLWSDIAASGNNEADVTGTTVWVSNPHDTTLNLAGKVAVAEIVPPLNRGRETTVNSPEYRYATAAVRAEAAEVSARGAVAVILVADSTTEIAYDGLRIIGGWGTYAVDGLGGRGGGRGGAAANGAPIGTGAACGGGSATSCPA